MHVLGIETSCDETGVAVYSTTDGLLAHEVYSQIDLHRVYGGVVPEIASRDHVRRVVPLVNDCLLSADIRGTSLDAVCYTAGPGLAGALLVGAGAAHGLAAGWGVPVLGLHHMEGHLLAPLLEPNPPEYPFVALLVSGGHTLLVDVTGLGEYEALGTSLDDAVGEAFDKTAKLLGLGYPGGPALARLAEEGDPERFPMPRPMTQRPGLDFSFSGLKTHAMTTWRAAGQDPSDAADLAASFQRAIVDTLVIKCRRAMAATGRGTLIISGGVSANVELRQSLQKLGKKEGWGVYFPRPEFSTDNGAMMAHVGALRLAAGERHNGGLGVRPRWPLEELRPPAKEPLA